ncbi:DUF4129 domain-containing transglutaminase family protein [Peribacillus alkalitolerans]|uniref:DUF4129 domain-containing transglutaminase family protein n=1 Tax=Peribacillus alkalitolerans TaxID=1550385 RepID=UPI0013D41BD2|nr:DUF4129 domain-containing transglutaminase family protein [Peribacillus alkalitolerans]
MNLHLNRLEKVGNLLFYIAGLFLLWEWMRPLEILTETSNLSVFIIFMGLAFLLQYLRWRFVFRFIILSIYILWSIHKLYFEGIFFVNPKWLVVWSTEIANNFSLMISQDWSEITYSFQTLLFFLLLALMTYLVHYWVVIRRKLFLFFFMTVVFITVLDTFSPYDGNAAIVRVLVIGLLTLGLLALYRLTLEERLSMESTFLKKWLVPLLIFILVGAATGFAMPKHKPQWPDPVPYIISYSEKFKDDEGTKKVGYGEDDSKLGGDFEEDDTVIFTATADTKHYWKIESKDVYTGKGWEPYIDSRAGDFAFRNGEEVEYFKYPLGFKAFKHTDQVKIQVGYQHVPYPEPLAFTKITADQKESQYVFRGMDEKVAGGLPLISQYSIDYQVPVFNLDELRKITDEFVSNTNDPTVMDTVYAIMPERYTNLPNTIPSRVRELAESLTADKENWYDKVKAIENHFDNPDFVYDRVDIPYPEENQDYVDQFLFETMRGYCDNFSTSMVVMLRSIGIPAKWVKGYSDGQLLETKSGRSTYEISNNNAHSWVEVYFPTIGWVPFEPTKGFSNRTRFESTINANENVDDKPLEEKTQPNQPQPEVKDETKKNTKKFSLQEQIENTVVYLKENLFKFLFYILVISGILYAIYKNRGKLLPRFWLFYYRSIQSEEAFLRAYPVLLKELQRYGLMRQPHQTLWDYANYIDSYFMINDMKKLTKNYEKVVYGGKQSKEEWEQSRELWENLIKRTIA